MSEIDAILARLRAQMDLDSETEHELLEEMRCHLEDAAASAQEQGLDEGQALAQAAARLDVDHMGAGLQDVHAGWSTADAVFAAGLPVMLALVLRWLVFAPDGSAIGWQQILARPAFWVIAVVALLVPLLKFGRWRYGLVSWAFFWVISVVFALLPALRY